MPAGEGCLALPKLNLQFLTPHDYLLRNFNLFRCGTACVLSLACVLSPSCVLSLACVLFPACVLSLACALSLARMLSLACVLYPARVLSPARIPAS